MYLKIPFGKQFTCFMMLSALCLTSNAQKLQKQTDLKKLKKSQVYKNQKMFDSKTGSTNAKTPIQRQADNAIERAKYEFERLKNPNTNEIPLGIRESEVKFSTGIEINNESFISSRSSQRSSSGFYYNWRNRGPFNVGGRTRALAIDRNNENVILAGGVSGGLWRTENGGQTWRKVTRNFQDPSITTIIQDPRPNKSFTWYYASGERFGSAGAGGALYQGSGVYKSQDGGRTWESLRATTNANVGGFESGFDLINSIAINPTNGDLYVATFDGLYRSQDGGNSFAQVFDGGFDNFTEVSITSTGVIYMTVSSRLAAGENPGFFTSTDGENWTNITPQALLNLAASGYGRTVMGIDPSDEDIVYFLTQFDFNDVELPILHRFNANPEVNEEIWTELTDNLPTDIGGDVGDLNPQGGYNLLVKVHPTDSNIVFVGGTNLYRSTDAFATQAGQESWVAGYSPLNDISLYTDQHPDQHALVFYPSNPNRALSGNDGGVFITEDITATNEGIEPVEWDSLNNGYLTTQPYHVAFNPEGTDDNLVAGFQDNGTWFTNSSDPTAAWVEDFGGDGAYSAIADNGRTRYVSSQRGNIFRFNFDENGGFESFTVVRPEGPGNRDFSFVNPFILDPINDNIMYMPIQGRIWRNRNLDEIPLFLRGRASENWTNIASSQTPDNSTITSLGISKYPVANRLYYGTNSGMVLRMDNANVDNQEIVDITTGKGLPNGFVNDINVDPSNSDRVIITLSNYGIPSLFFTNDGGETWTDISGNLEENRDGTGNGPSVRSTAFFGPEGRNRWSRSQKIYAATSTGLFVTSYLNGQNTVWRKENNRIGTAVTDEVVTRNDGLVAVAAHGNGLFSARFPVTGEFPEASLSTNFLLDDIELPANSEDTVIDVTDLFVHSNNEAIAIELTNSNPELVTATLVGNTLTLSYAQDGMGSASIALIATAGNEQVSEGFTVTIAELPIYAQSNAAISNVPSQNFTDFNGIAQSADDFVVPEGNSWNINRLVAFGIGSSDFYNNATVVVYNDNDGVPGEEIYNSGELVPVSDVADANLNIELPEVLSLESGNYWVSVYANLAFNGGGQWFWSSEANTVGGVTQFRDQENLFRIGAVDWTATNVALGRAPIDQSFQLFGDIVNDNGDTNTNEAAPLTTLDTKFNSLAWPNPSNNSFNFDLRIMNSEKEVSMKIFDMAGKVVYKASDIDTKSNHVWDASRMSTGFYFVSLEGNKTTKRFKIIKK